MICIAGGSGAGKTTLAAAIVARLGVETASVLHLDDFQREKGRVPRHITRNGTLRRNFEHPSTVDWDRCASALQALKSGEDAVIEDRRRCGTAEAGVVPHETVVVPARAVVIVEGYLALCIEGVRRLYDTSVFLRLSEEKRVARRRWAKDRQYVDEVLLPMHGYFVEPTAAHADLLIDVDGLSPETVCSKAMAFLSWRNGRR